MSGPVGDAAPGRRLARWALTLGPLLVLGLALAWWAGALEPLAQSLARAQRAMQGQLAGALRALKSGQSWAWAGLMAMAFAYGFLHAAGPGHGKLVIGGYGMARRIRLRALLGLTLAASLAQAAVAVGLVMGGALVLGWGRDRLEWAGERVLAPLGSALILGLGLWIALRGVWHLWHRARPGPAAAGGQGHGHGQAHDHDHGHGHDHPHGHGDGHDHSHDLGHAGHWHAHGPTAEDVARLRGPWDAALLIGSIAIRPCTGALFLMIVTLAMGAPWAGISGVFVMGLGTAAFTGLVAALSVWAREGAVQGLERPGARLALAAIEVLAGLGIALAAGLLLGQGV